MTAIIKKAPIIPAKPRRPSVMGMDPFQGFFSDFFHDPWPVIRQSTEGYPVTDLYENTNGEQVIEMALAGFDKDSIQIEVKDNSITIKSESQIVDEDKQSYRRIAKRAFSRTFVDYDGKLDLANAKATFENGLLSLVLPKVPEKQPQVINIK